MYTCTMVLKRYCLKKRYLNVEKRVRSIKRDYVGQIGLHACRVFQCRHRLEDNHD